MGAKTIFAGDGVFEDEVFEGFQGKRHVAAKENKKADTREIGKDVPHGGKGNNSIKSELAQNDGDEEGGDVYRENRLFGNSFVGVKNERDEECENKETHEFGAEVVLVFAVKVAVVKGPD